MNALRPAPADPRAPERPGEELPPRSAPDFRAGLWRLADPKITLASMASLFLGVSFAAADGPLSPGWLALTVAGIFFLEVAKNASGEIFDFDSGTDRAVGPEDRSPFSGGKRVLVDGLLSRGQTRAIAAAGYLLAIAAGLAIAAFREPAVLGFGVAGVALAFFYHAPPFKLSYRGFGELAVAVVYGPLIAVGAYVVQRGAVDPGILRASLPLGLLIAGFLWVSEFPDYRADLGAGKRNLVVRLGRVRASRLFALGMAAGVGSTLLLPLAGLPGTVALGAVSGVPATLAAARLLRNPESTAEIIPAQALTLWAFLLLSLGCGLGALLSR
jgi:1,4-dihydroxy-2-naphthoate octaprenyltransferase